MDELKLTLQSRFMKNIVTKLLSKVIFKKTGYEVNIQLNGIKVETVDGKVDIHMDANVEMNSEDLVKLLKSKDLL